MKLVSIIVPVYNSEKYLSKCIESIINQTYFLWELILVNDGSTDNSEEIIRRYKNLDKRIKSFYFDNRGVAASRNFGINQAQGEYITFIDSDDYVESEYLEKLVYGIEKYNCDLSSCDLTEVYKDDVRIIKSLNTVKKTEFVVDSIRIINDLLYHKIKNGYSCAKLWKKSIIKQLFQNYCYCEDVLFLVNNLSKDDYKIYVVHEPLYVYVRNENSVTMIKNPKKIIDMLNVADKIIKESELSEMMNIKSAEALLIDYSFYILLHSRDNEELKRLYNICKQNIRKYRKSVLFDFNSSIKTKIACILSFFPDGFLTFVYNLQPNKSL